MDITERYVPKKTRLYQQEIGRQFADVWAAGRPISWLDIGAGYGEIIDAVTALAPKGSSVSGLEPMEPKARAAKARGLNVINDYLGPSTPKTQYASLVNVFSHLNDFDGFMRQVHAVLLEGGELFFETGNAAELKLRSNFPGTLGLPDHVAFAGEKHVIGYLDRAGFDIVSINRVRVDGLIYTAKNVVKSLIGRETLVKLPYASAYRTLRVRAKKRA